MTLYEILLFVHIVGAAIWVGGGVTLLILGMRIGRTADVQMRLRYIKDTAFAGPLIGASAMVVLLAGIGMVLESDVIELSQLWVWLGLVLFAVSGITGGAYFGPTGKKIEKALSEGQVDEANRLTRQITNVSRFDVLLLLVIVGLMVFKPGV
jgi:uncharacterized membrane protein